MQLAVGEIVPAANKFRELLQKLIASDTRNAMAMAISVALNTPIDRPHSGAFPDVVAAARKGPLSEKRHPF